MSAEIKTAELMISARKYAVITFLFLNTKDIMNFQSRYFGLGWSLSVLEKLLLIGVPFASVSGGEQNGAVVSISSNKSLKGQVILKQDGPIILNIVQ